MAHNELNLAADLSKEKLDEISELVNREFEIDEANFSTRKTRILELYKLALQAIEAKDYPWPKSSNIKLPLITEAALNFSSMAYPSIVKDEKVVKAKVVGSDDGDEVIKGADGKPVVDPKTGKEKRKNAGLKLKISKRVSKFMSYQVLEDMDGWEDDMDKILLINPIIGCSFKKVYYCPLERKNVSRLVLPQFLIININARSVETANRASELIELYPGEIDEMVRVGAFLEFDYNISDETLSDNYNQGEKEGGSHIADLDLPHLFIEQHRKLDLDDDGYAEPYIVTFHKKTHEVVRILPRYDAEDVLHGKDGKIIKIKVHSQYVKFGFIPDPEGSPYDIGFGHLLQHLNEGANACINQMLDQGKRYTMGGGLIGDGLRMKGGTIRFKPGEWKRVKAQGMTIRESMFPLPMAEPSVVLMSLLEYIISGAKDMAAMTKVMAGDIPANMPATTAMASIEQGMQSFKAVYKRIHRSLKKEFKILFYLNQQYLSQEEYMNVLDDKAADVELDFVAGLVDVIPLSDPEMLTSTQSYIYAQFLMGFIDNPRVDQQELLERIFKAMNTKDIDDLVIEPPPAQTDPVVEAQVGALQSQIVTQKNEAEIKKRTADRDDMKFKLDIEKHIVQSKKDLSASVLNLARAESEEEGAQLDQYRHQLEENKLQLDIYTQLKEKLDGDNQGIVGGMANPANDGGVL